MEVAIRKMGILQSVLIPGPIFSQVGLDGPADLQVRDGVIEIRPVRRNPRAGALGPGLYLPFIVESMNLTLDPGGRTRRSNDNNAHAPQQAFPHAAPPSSSPSISLALCSTRTTSMPSGIGK